jgi:hypothetical protein
MTPTHAFFIERRLRSKGRSFFRLRHTWKGLGRRRYPFRECFSNVRLCLSVLFLLICPVSLTRHMRTASDDDYAAALLARALGKPDEIVDFLLQRAMEAPFTIWNPKTKFMEARNANGTFAGQDAGWTEGSEVFCRFFASFSDWSGK